MIGKILSATASTLLIDKVQKILQEALTSYVLTSYS